MKVILLSIIVQQFLCGAFAEVAVDTFATSKDKPSVVIFYDAMDPSSQFFFNTTMINQTNYLPTFFSITLIPCQLAKENAGALSCSVPADPTCKLNKIHSCAIDLIPDKVQLINYLACTMKGTQSLPDFAACACQYKVDDAAIQQCAASDKGKNLCVAYVGKQMSDMNTLPGLVFKKPEDIKATDLYQYLDYYRTTVARRDLQLALCAKLKVTKVPSPPVCNEKLILGIFYKAMSDKTRNWFRAFGSVYDMFKDRIVIKYEPCMMAEISANGRLNCQDPNDKYCIMGITHACAISSISNSTLLYQFLNCTLQGPTLPSQLALEKCATDIGIEYEPIKACASSESGKNLCYNYSKTRPNSIDFPTFSYELAFDEAVSKKTSEATDLKGVFCEQLKNYGISFPPDCDKKC